MQAHDGRPHYRLEPPEDPYGTAPGVNVFPSALGPVVVLGLSTRASPYWPMRELTPDEARAVSKALGDAAAIVEAGTFRPWEDPSQRAPKGDG
jgi:hypothetical protein